MHIGLVRTLFLYGTCLMCMHVLSAMVVGQDFHELRRGRLYPLAKMKTAVELVVSWHVHTLSAPHLLVVGCCCAGRAH